MKTYLLKIQDDTWHRFKIAAAVKGHTLKAALETAIFMYIRNTKPEDKSPVKADKK
jgi:hypothetical protein